MSTIKVNTINVESGNVVTVGADCHVTGNLIVTGALHARTTDFVVSSNSTTLGDAASDTITINALSVSTPNKLAISGHATSNALMLTGSLNVSGSGITLTAAGPAASAVLTMKADDGENAADTMTLTVADGGTTTLATTGGSSNIVLSSSAVIVADSGEGQIAFAQDATTRGYIKTSTANYLDIADKYASARIRVHGHTNKATPEAGQIQMTGSLNVTGSGISLIAVGDAASAVLTMKADNGEDATDTMTLTVADGGTTTIATSGNIALSADGGNVTMDDGTNTVFDFDTDNVIFKMMDDADTGDYFSIAVAANGATTLSTLDDDTTLGNLTLSPNGDIILNPDANHIHLHDSDTLRGSIDVSTANELSFLGPNGFSKLKTTGAAKAEDGSVQVTGSFEVTGSGISLIAVGDAASAVLTMKADNGEDAADTMTLTVADGGDTTLATAGGDIIFNPAGNNVLPGGDSEDDLGADGTAWRKLYVDDIDLNGVGRIDLDADADTSIRSSAEDVIKLEAGGTDIVAVTVNGAQITGSLSVSGSVELGGPIATFKTHGEAGEAAAVFITGSGINLVGPQNGAAHVLLSADKGDDNGDDWKVIANTDQTLTIGNDIGGSNAAQLTITPNSTAADSVTTVGKLKLAGNVVQASDGGASITLDTSDNVTIGGDLTVSGGDISYANSANATFSMAATAHDTAGKDIDISAGSTTAGTTSDIAGGHLKLKGGQAKGDAAGGSVQIHTTTPGASGNSINDYVAHVYHSGSGGAGHDGLQRRSTFDSVVDFRRNNEVVTGDKTLTNHDSGKVIFINGDTITVTLPDSAHAYNTGCWFTFYSSAGTSNANMHKVVCADTTNEKIYGWLKMYDTDTANTYTVVTGAAGTFNVSSIVLNGTTGGAVGSTWTMMAVAADKWQILEGNILHGGAANGTDGQYIFREA